MKVYVVTYNCYLQYETGYTEIHGVFSSKANAEFYIKQHQHELSGDNYYDAEYFEIIEQELDGESYDQYC